MFTDFDGTITTQDVGNAFFRTYVRGDYDALLDDYLAERISAAECFRRGAQAIGAVDRDAVMAFFRQQPVDPTFAGFVTFCRTRGLDLAIVSDGLDAYINAILDEHHIETVPVYANTLTWVPAEAPGLSTVGISFPFADATCTRCACSKRNILLTCAGDEDIIVYIGEGYSDRCPVQYADIVFAKDQLQRFCQEKNISYYLYSSFADVQTRMEGLLGKARLRKRRQAESMRRDAFLRE